MQTAVPAITMSFMRTASPGRTVIAAAGNADGVFFDCAGTRPRLAVADDLRLGVRPGRDDARCRDPAHTGNSLRRARPTCQGPAPCPSRRVRRDEPASPELLLRETWSLLSQ